LEIRNLKIDQSDNTHTLTLIVSRKSDVIVNKLRQWK